MDAEFDHGATTEGGLAAWAARFAPAALEIDADLVPELAALIRSGASYADGCEHVLAMAARAVGAIEVEIAEGLDALRRGERLARLGCHLDDYGREVLDLGKRAVESLAALGAGLRTRPLLREALRSGRVRLRAAQTVLPVALGEAEAEWVARAERSTVRELEAAVRRARATEPEEDWLRMRLHLSEGERTVVDAALELAGEVMPGSSRMERLEAMAQEFLGTFPGDPDTPRPLGPAFRPVVGGERERREALECETERWAVLEAVAPCPAPEAGLDDGALTAEQLDRRLRTLARLRRGWDAIVGSCAAVVKRSGMHRLLGFASFRHFAEERLGLEGRTVEERARLEQRLWGSPALQEARRQRLSYERLRLLARLPEREIRSWIAVAKAVTVVELRARVDGEAERQMRASGRMAAALPRRVAVVVASAVEMARALAGAPLSAGRCLALVAKHFLDTWAGLAEPRRTVSRRTRERDGHRCQVPGCSRRATHAHHVAFRSHGGTDDPENLVGVCAFHHLRCIHAGHLRVEGRAPDALTWFLGGEAWRGPGLD